MACFECGHTGETQPHHVVPKSRGGTKTVDLCLKCHAKAHHRNGNMAHSRLTKEALDKRRAEGKSVGRPPFGFSVDADGYLVRNEREQTAIRQIVRLRSRGMSLREIAEHLTSKRALKPRGKRWHATTIARILTEYDTEQRKLF